MGREGEERRDVCVGREGEERRDVCVVEWGGGCVHKCCL